MFIEKGENKNKKNANKKKKIKTKKNKSQYVAHVFLCFSPPTDSNLPMPDIDWWLLDLLRL